MPHKTFTGLSQPIQLRCRSSSWSHTCLLSKRSPWKRQTKEVSNRIARCCEGGGHSSSLSTLYRQRFKIRWWSTGASAGILLGPGVVLLLHINIWLADYTRQSNLLSNGRWQLQRKASNTFSAGPAGPCNLAVMCYSAELSLTKKRFSFWNYVVSTEKNMELRCVQTQINGILKKIMYIYILFRFWQGQQRRPCWPWRPTTVQIKLERNDCMCSE